MMVQLAVSPGSNSNPFNPVGVIAPPFFMSTIHSSVSDPKRSSFRLEKTTVSDVETSSIVSLTVK